MELIAHRAGNRRATLDAAAAVADAVELDVHRFRGRLEVRHAKVLWPTSLLWERWTFVTDVDRPTLSEIVELLPPDVHLWLDLKGFDRRLTREALATTQRFDRVTISSRSWWILAPGHRRDGARVMRSIGNKAQRWLAEHTSRRTARSTTRGSVLHERLVRPGTVQRLRRGGPVIAWGATTAERVGELERLGVDGVILDDLDLLPRPPGESTRASEGDRAP